MPLITKKKTWERIRTEYFDGRCAFLCYGSKTFHKAWNSKKDKRIIQDWNEEFVSNRNDVEVSPYSFVLFKLLNKSPVSARNLRKEFISWVLYNKIQTPKKIREYVPDAVLATCIYLGFLFYFILVLPLLMTGLIIEFFTRKKC